MGILSRTGTAVALALSVSSIAGPSVLAAQDVDLSAIGYVVGHDTAAVTIIEFGDYACSACAEFHRDSWPTVKRELVDRGVVLWRHVPFLLGFRRGREGALAAQCAADQEAFWEMHDLLFRRQTEWTKGDDPDDRLAEYAGELGLDVDAFRACWDSDAPGDRIDAANDAAKDLGIRVQGALPAEAFLELARAARARAAAEPSSGGP